jgi:hypothetical protein
MVESVMVVCGRAREVTLVMDVTITVPTLTQPRYATSASVKYNPLAPHFKPSVAEFSH